MNEAEIRKYAGLMQELGLTGLEIRVDNQTVRLERAAPVAERQAATILAVPTDAPQAAREAAD